MSMPAKPSIFSVTKYKYYSVTDGSALSVVVVTLGGTPHAIAQEVWQKFGVYRDVVSQFMAAHNEYVVNVHWGGKLPDDTCLTVQGAAKLARELSNSKDYKGRAELKSLSAYLETLA